MPYPTRLDAHRWGRFGLTCTTPQAEDLHPSVPTHGTATTNLGVDVDGVEPSGAPCKGAPHPHAHARSAAVDRRGLEPRSPACDAGVLPLDEQPVSVVCDPREHDEAHAPAARTLHATIAGARPCRRFAMSFRPTGLCVWIVMSGHHRSCSTIHAMTSYPVRSR